jgi:hypothetical protein
MRLSEVLREPCDWTIGHYAVNNNGDPTLPESPTACKWCISGALLKVMNTGNVLAPEFRRMSSIIIRLYPERIKDDHHGFPNTIAYFNDHPATTFEDVVKVIKEYENES